MKKLNVLSQLWRYMKKARFSLAGAVIFALLSGGLSLLGPYYIGQAVDIIGQASWSKIAYYLIFLGIIYLLSAFFMYLMNICTNALAYKTTALMRKDCFFQLTRLPISYIDSHSRGDIYSRLTNDADTACEGMLQSISQLFSGIIVILGSFGFMLALSPVITFVVLLITPISFLIAYFITKHSRRRFREQAARTGELSGFAEEMLAGMPVVTAFGYNNEAIARFEKTNQELYECGQKAQFYSSLTNPTTRLVNNAAYVLVGVLGVFMALDGRMSVGLILSFLTYATQFAKPINEITGVISQLQSALAALERIFGLLGLEPEPDEAEKITVEPESIRGDIQFIHASFSYIPEKPLITDFSFHAKPGSMNAIVGPTGAGKTTLVNLLMRFYELNGGQILLDGTDIKDIKRESLRSCFAMVLQETWLFNGTIRENIAYGMPQASDEEIVQAAKAAYAHDFISRMPDGYNSIITEDGENLSQGEKQLLTIARAMLLKPPMLILDEATSSVDTRTEQKIQMAFKAAMKGRTSFVIAHRLSTIQDADVIIVMNKGDIVEYGSHDQLIKKKGFYYELYNSQFAPAENS
ncbi:MAG: sugar ABC transporter ATP-binding protein [Selenomonadales bacterium]|nr:MAG: sugar ABC transporter ATP-binding protein [Selenomonadales bacterium]